MFREYLNRVYQGLITGGRKPRSRRAPRTSRPEAARLAVVGLEDRTLLSTFVLSSGALTYRQSANVSSTLTMYYDSSQHRYDFNDTTETISLQGNFINPLGNGGHIVSFGDSNINSIRLYALNQTFTANIDQTLSGVPLTVNLGNGSDTVNINPATHILDLIQGPITINPGQVGYDLNVNDQSNGFSQTYSIGAHSVSRPGAALISYNGLASVYIYAGNGNNNYNVSNTALYGTSLHTGNGHDTVNVAGTAYRSVLAIYEGTGGVNVNVGYASHNLDNVLGTIDVYGAEMGVDNLVVNDQANASNQTYTLAPVQGGDEISWTTSSGVIAYTSASNLTLYGGTGANTFNVEVTGVPTAIVGSASATVNVGHNGSLQQISGSLTITDPPSNAYVTLNVHDENDVGGRTATLQTATINGGFYGQITGLSPGAIAYRYLDTSSVNVNTPGGATVNALATVVPVNLLCRTLSTVNVGSAGSVQTIAAALTISQASADAVAVNVDDSADARYHTATLQTINFGGASYGEITGLSPAPITGEYGTGATVTVQTGTGGATVNALATGVPVRLIAHSFNTTFNVGNAGSVQQILGPLTITNPPSATTVNVDDSADGSARNVTLDTVMIGTSFYGRITGLAPAAIQYTSNVTIETGPGGAAVHALATFSPVNLIGNPSGPVSLFASDAANTWTVTGQNAGTLSSALLFGPVTFSGATNLTGGNGADTFVFADGAGVDGTIDGGGGTNTLDYSAYSSTVLVDLQTGSATAVGTGIANIQNVTGGSGGGAGVYNILVGNGGNVLTGGDGRRNLLIAGASASTLLGGTDDDILIGGTTAYDTEAGLVSLQAIMDYWSSTTDDYGTRVANLLSGNGVPLLDATMVTNNGGGNTLLGNHGGAGEMNLFYGLDPTLETTDYNAALGEQFINC
jgi:hypothetical protein